MTTPEQQTLEQWRAEALEHAQAQALSWAEQAETAYIAAVDHEESARARHRTRTVYNSHLAGESRAQADLYGARCTEAMKLAEMWANVALSVRPGAPAP
ncbi:hypothetical protein [Streptomyces hygroscopicus]|uniref:hypothetical protein n=1 Tax=Streptomyces hygroscopicus TaxID=1912 RepID=UPI0007679EE7|nr:hypothetical protein [Streptomyces hygroscopicus]